MSQLFTNNAATLLAAGISNVATSLSVTAGTGNEFPSIAALGADNFLLTLFKIVDGVEASHEIVKVTVRAPGTPDAMTIVRAQEGTTALAFNAGDRVELRLTKGFLESLLTQLLAKAALAANTFTGDQTFGNNNLKAIKTATFNSQADLTATSGNIAIDWSAAQNYKQTEPTGAINYNLGGFTAPPGPCHLQLLIESDGTSAAQTFTWPAAVIWYGSTFAHVAHKKMIVNFWYDGTNYHGTWMSKV